MGPEKYIVTVKDKDGNSNPFKAVAGERIQINTPTGKVFFTVGVTKESDLPRNVKIEHLTRDNKYKLKKAKTKKLTIK